MSEMRYRHFLLFDAVAVAVWATAVALLGYFLDVRGWTWWTRSCPGSGGVSSLCWCS
jgi:membrane protein DedA with SNARE-associated domain